MLARRYWIGIVLVFAFAIHAPTLRNEYAFDAHLTCEKSPLVLELQLIETFRSDYWGGSGEDQQTNPLYRPITVLSYVAVDRLLGGGGTGKRPAPLPQHLVDILLHCAAVWLVFTLVRRLTGPGLAPLLAALVFAANAIHTEVVASVVGRADLLAFVFGAMALHAWLAVHADGKGRARLALAGVLLWLAFCSKESALAWAPFLVVYAVVAEAMNGDGWRPGRWTLRALAVAAIPVLLWLGLRWNAFQGLAGTWQISYVSNDLAPPHADAAARVLSATRNWGYGLWLTLVPWNLSCDYAPLVFGRVASVADPAFLAALVVLLGCLGAALALARRSPLLLAAVGAWYGFSVLTTNLAFPIGAVFAERLYYMPSLGLSFFVAWLALRTSGRGRRLMTGCVLAWSLVFGIRTAVRCPDWYDDNTLFFGDVERSPRSLSLLLQCSILSRLSGDLEASDRYLRKMIEIQPDYALAYSELWGNMIRGGRFEEAARTIEQGLDAKIIDRRKHGTGLHLNAAIVYRETGQREKALAQLRAVIAADPSASPFRYRVLVYGESLLPEDEAERLIAEGEALDAGAPFWGFLRGRRAFRSGNYADAVRRLRPTLRRMPMSDIAVQDTFLQFAESLARTGDTKASAGVLKRILADPSFAAPQLRERASEYLRQLEGR